MKTRVHFTKLGIITNRTLWHYAISSTSLSNYFFGKISFPIVRELVSSFLRHKFYGFFKNRLRPLPHVQDKAGLFE